MDALLAENINTLLHRARMTGRSLGRELGINHATIARKLAGGTWTFSEVAAVAQYFQVTLEEIATTLPTRKEWEGRWVAVHPLGLEPRTRCFTVLTGGASVNRPLTVVGRPRHLWAVA